MKTITYNKLVRDRIPEIIMASGKSCVTEVLNDDEYLKMLDAKLDEELTEYHKDQNIEELADLLEVLCACAVARGYSVDQLEQVRAEKAQKRGGFMEKVFLKEVCEESHNTLLYTKNVDWSLFKAGFAIPLDVQHILQTIPDLKATPGETRDIRLAIEGQICPATLCNLCIDLEKYPDRSPIIQIRYKASDKAAVRFQDIFLETWDEMRSVKDSLPSKKHLHSDRKETISIYTTTDPTLFIIECHTLRGD